jgi:hypothetical protein
MPTPYAEHVAGRDPVDVLKTSLDDYRAIMPRLTPALWNQPWAPGKWTLRQILVHVTQWEMIFGIRCRCGVGMPNYTVEPLEQDDLMRAESLVVDGPTAFAAFEAVRRMNLALASSLSTAQRRQPVQHPERGRIDVNDLLVTMAGHPVHHLKQLQSVVG